MTNTTTDHKAALAGLKDAQANMKAAIDRIFQLEQALGNAIQHLESSASYLDKCYGYDSKQTRRDYYLEKAADLKKLL